MNLLLVVAASAVVLLIAYFTYGRVLSRWLQLDPNAITPSEALRDDKDFVPTETKFLLGQHFSAIAAAGPIVGPIAAGIIFGWVPALLWILVGSILIGGVHDMAALVASIRHKARSIAEVVREHMSQRSYLLFLSFIWIALVYIIVAFADLTAGALVAAPMEESGGVSGPAIATSSLIYLALPIIMGLLLRYTKLSLGWATILFLPLVGLAIWVGQYIPFDMTQIVSSFQPGLTAAEANLAARQTWDVLLLIYCLIAGMTPVWLLLQPRGHLGGYFLYAALAAGGIGVLIGNFSIQYPEFRGFAVDTPRGVQMLFPILFITIACGACSGFHSLIASGTTSKQLRRETDARAIGYGSMLLEAMVAILALGTVMILSRESETDKVLLTKDPNVIYANGLGTFLATLGISAKFGAAFGLMAFTTFVYDTLDVCTRLGRYIIQELTGLRGRLGGWLGTGLTAGLPIFFVMGNTLDAAGNPIPAWKVFWNLFGASNQLLAALTLIGLTVWLWKTRRAMWALFAVGLPAALMYTMSVWALVSITRSKLTSGPTYDPIVGWASVVLLTLAGLMLIEAIIAFFGRPAPPQRPTVPEPLPATA